MTVMTKEHDERNACTNYFSPRGSINEVLTVL
jgi:hypothetical protein